MTIQYTVSIKGRRIAEWFEDRETPPAKKFVLIPIEIVQRQELRGFFRRSVVIGETKTKNGYVVQLEAVKMPPLNGAEN